MMENSIDTDPITRYENTYRIHVRTKTFPNYIQFVVCASGTILPMPGCCSSEPRERLPFRCAAVDHPTNLD